MIRQLLLLLLFVSAATGQVSYEDAARSVDADLKAALAELASFRQQVANERPPLALETETIASELRTKRSLLGIGNREQDSFQSERLDLENDVAALQAEADSVRGLIREYASALQSHMHPPELSIDSPRFIAAGTNATEALALVDHGIARLPGLFGSRVMPGEALDSDGRLETGDFVEAGPALWFRGSSTTGLVRENAKLQSELLASPASGVAIDELIAGREAAAEIDVSFGTASDLQAEGGGLLAHIKKGGVWIFPILFLAAIALIAALMKWMQLLRIRRVRPAVLSTVLAHLRADEISEAKAAVKKHVSPPARQLLQRGIELRGRPRDVVEEALFEEYLAAQPPLKKWLPFISITAATAPLLGLLGTVTGIISTFELINVFGTGDASTLAGGISEALVTTEFGLVVAIPALIIHAYLSRRAQAIRSDLEMTSLAFLNGLETGGNE